ncbi:tetratricopeptide repeat protein [Actinopolymorpha pittospori]|uniref:Thioredoxin n=1 Tax=Actinopolymorpha pittospori TaxID=648752 RepID=A0A927RPU8_9ACTN|nr:tetratricopeptide repeat protein [Actinopolymorpha pittospori]MBE1611538.1 putative thioredoxin [Actinopolymorpha pittospori]
MTGNFSRYGAVDLSGLAASSTPSAAASGARGGAPAGSAPGGYVIDVTEATFQQDVVDRSATVPVVIDFWATWCQPCKQLSPILERLATDYAGKFLLAKIDVDENPRLSQAAGIQSIPLVVAVVRGQLVPLFQGALPEAQVRQFIDELLRLAVAQGVTGTIDPVEGEPAPVEDEEAGDPRYAEADAAIAAGDLDGAVLAFEKVLAQAPADAEAKRGLAQAKLLRRIQDVDPAQVRADAAASPDEPKVQSLAADLDVADGRMQEGFRRLIDAIRRTSGDERDALRVHLLELFEAIGSEEELVRAARRELSSALF